jgi:hypothetical protein
VRKVAAHFERLNAVMAKIRIGLTHHLQRIKDQKTIITQMMKKDGLKPIIGQILMLVIVKVQ